MTDAHAPTQTIAGRYWLELLALIPRAARPRAIELMLELRGEYARQDVEADARGFRDGHRQAAEQASREAEERGYREGWKAAVAEIMGKTGSPALALPEDPLSPPEPPPS